MSLILAYKSRGVTKDITILDGDNEAIAPDSADHIRATITREGKTALLEVSSQANTANGSSFTKNSPSAGVNRLRLDASDLTMAAGVYSLQVDLYDSDDVQEWKRVSTQVMVIRE